MIYGLFFMVEKIGKEHKMKGCTYVSSKFGTLDRDNPSVMYVSGRCWGPASSVTQVIDDLESKVGSCVTTSQLDTKLGSAFTGSNVSSVTDYIVALSSNTPSDFYSKRQIDDALGNLITVTSITSSVTDYIEMVSFVNSQAYNDLMAYCQQLEARIHALENQP